MSDICHVLIHRVDWTSLPQSLIKMAKRMLPNEIYQNCFDIHPSHNSRKVASIELHEKEAILSDFLTKSATVVDCMVLRYCGEGSHYQNVEYFISFKGNWIPLIDVDKDAIL